MRCAILICLVALPVWAEVETLEDLKPIERAHESVDHVKKNFRAALQKALKTSKPEKAIGACRIDAAAAMKAATNPGTEIEVGRTSHKLRNPKNAPRDWMKPILAKWSTAKRSEIPKNELVNLGPNYYGYAEPIFIEPVCLNCHGNTLTKPVVQALDMDYPEDQATGFALGDFRGLFWLEMKKRK